MSTPAELVARGIAFAQSGRWEAALAEFEQCAALVPRDAAIWSNVAFARRNLGRTAEAADAIARALAIDASIADAWNISGLVEQDRRDFDKARSQFARATALNARFAAAWMNLGNSEHALGHASAAQDAFAKALALDARMPELHYNLGLLHQNATGDLERAIGHYREAARLAPDYALAHHNLAHALFLTGRFDEAWREHVWRRGSAREVRPLAGSQRVAIVAEQGLGDILFYLRYAPALQASGTVLDFAGDRRLHPMLARTGLFATLAAKPGELAPAANTILAGDLPLATGSTKVAPPLPLAADRARRDAMLVRLQALGRPPYVAVAWRAGVPKTGLHEVLYKAVPAERLGAALKPLRATFVSVQREPKADEVAAITATLGQPLHDFSAVNADLEDILALMDCTQAYIGVSSTNVHLRASLGREADVLVPFPPEWRWMAAGDSPWFPLARTHRQDRSRDWEPALAALAQQAGTRLIPRT